MKLLDLLLFGLAGYLGFFDGYFERVLKIFGQDPWHSETLIEIKRQARVSQVLGYLALIVSEFIVYSNNSLTDIQKLGQFSTNLLGFGLTVWIGSAIASTAGLPIIIAGVLTMAVAIGIYQAISMINTIYFSFVFWFRKNYA